MDGVRLHTIPPNYSSSLVWKRNLGMPRIATDLLTEFMSYSLIKLWFWRKETFQLKPNSLNFFLDFHTNYAQKECTSVWLQSVGGIGESNSSIFCHISSFCIMLMHEIRWELMIYFNLNASAYIPPHILIPKCNFFLNNKLPT